MNYHRLIAVVFTFLIISVFVVTSNIEFYAYSHHQQCIQADCGNHGAEYQNHLEDHSSTTSSENSDCDGCENHLHICCHHSVAYIRNESSVLSIEVSRLEKFFQKKRTLKPSPFLDGPFRPPLV